MKDTMRNYRNIGSMEFIEWVNDNPSRNHRKAVWRCSNCRNVDIVSPNAANKRRLTHGYACLKCNVVISDSERGKDGKVKTKKSFGYDAVMLWLMLHKAKSIYRGRNKPDINLKELGRAWQLFRAEHRIVIR